MSKQSATDSHVWALMRGTFNHNLLMSAITQQLLLVVSKGTVSKFSCMCKSCMSLYLSKEELQTTSHIVGMIFNAKGACALQGKCSVVGMDVWHNSQSSR